MAGHLVSASVSRFHIGEGTDVLPAHFRSQGLLVNGVRSWQMIIKHDLTHRFDGLTLGVCHRVQSQGLLVNGVRSWQLIIKHDLTNQFHGWTLGVHPRCPGSISVRAPMLNRPTSGAKVEKWTTFEWCQKLAIDYKT